MLNLTSGEPLSLEKELPFLDNPIKLDPLLVSALDLCVNYLISEGLVHVVKVEICWFQLFCDIQGVQ
jgi:hypothetical protein